MYEEKRSKLTLKDILVQLLFVVLFVLILIWLFPTKGYMDKNYASNNEVSTIKEELQALYGRVFADNIESMKDAAQGYFTTSRLPKKVGDSVTLTLGDMLDKKLVLEFKDSNNQSCSTTKSYVQLTKMDDEFQMKVQLSCSDYEDYIIVYMGCYDYCQGGICESNTTTPVKPKPNTEKPTNNTQKPTTDNPNPKPVSKTYEYQYRKVTQNEFSKWSDWSNWSKKAVSANNLTNVEIKTEEELKGYTNSGWGITGYKTETYTDYEYTPVYETKKVKVGTTTIEVTENQTKTTRKLVDSKNPTVTKSQGTYSAWASAGTKKTINSTLVSNTTVRYTLISTDKVLNCNNSCVYDTVRIYKVEKRTYTEGKTTTTCPSGYTLENNKCNKYQNVTENVPTKKKVEVPVYENQTVLVRTDKKAITKTRQVPEYGYTSKKPVYETVTYYRYRTRTQTSVAGESIKWSKSSNDSTLLNAGYKLTGEKREV